MIPTRLGAIASFLLALPLFAQSVAPPRIDPPDPTSKDVVTLIIQQFDSCPPRPDVTRTGFDIAVTVHAGLCLFPPGLITHRLELGTLPAGEYNVIVSFPDYQGTRTKFSFVVLDANGSVQVSQPLGSTAGGTTVVVTNYSYPCAGTGCPLPTITFGGVPATNISTVGMRLFQATTPPHAAGPVEVRVSGSDVTSSSYAFRYYDPQAEPAPQFFEKILIPVIYNGPGALGSSWVTELSLRNDNAYPVAPWRAVEGKSSVPPIRPFRFGSADAPGGTFIIVPREVAAGLSLHAAVRDTTRSDREWATEVPVVRERDFSTNTIELLDLPSDSRYRITVRIYTLAAPRTVPPVVTVGVYSMDDDGQDLRRFAVTLGGTSSCRAPICFDQPGSGSLSISGNELPYPRIGIRIQPVGVPLWAFATVTNNETQHVTVVSPH